VSGVPAPLPARLDQSGASEIAATFGDEFTLALRNLPLKQWSGPVASGLGLHLVRIAARTAPEKPSLASVRQRLENDWRAAAVAKAQDTAYAAMAKGYDVVIEKPKE
jgi:peptidyl-prolyl cis-trans isomerase C